MFAMAALAIAMIAPAGAVTDGELDNDGHPQVVLLVADVGDGGWRCSATMLSPTVVLTAGHCVSNHPEDATIDGMRIFPDADVQQWVPEDPENPTLDQHYPGPGTHAIEAVSWKAHPLYETAPFFVHDVGIVILKEPGLVLDQEKYGELPEVDQLDVMKTKRGKQDTTFTAVGYGLQRINPVFVEAERVRMVAHPRLIQINTPGFTGDFSLLLSNNHSTGGTCFGDSGGPNFLGDTNVVAGVTSFGLNGNCAGTGGVFRMDRQNVLDFVNSFMD
jgi:secreted trypsin-like serine protease